MQKEENFKKLIRIEKAFNGLPGVCRKQDHVTVDLEFGRNWSNFDTGRSFDESV